jgi:hypothetical protein
VFDFGIAEGGEKGFVAFGAECMEAVVGGGGEDPAGAVALCEKVDGDSGVGSVFEDKRRT